MAHAHELEAAGKVRWSAKFKDGLLMVKDEASGEEVQATAYTIEGDTVLLVLAGESGPRRISPDDPSCEGLKKVIEKTPAPSSSAPASASGSTKT